EAVTTTFDQLVRALGAVTSYHGVPGAQEHTIGFKTLADAARARAHVVSCFEQAALEGDAAKRRALLTFVVASGGAGRFPARAAPLLPLAGRRAAAPGAGAPRAAAAGGADRLGGSLHSGPAAPAGNRRAAGHRRGGCRGRQRGAGARGHPANADGVLDGGGGARSPAGPAWRALRSSRRR